MPASVPNGDDSFLTVPALLRKYQIRPRKDLGQHFLSDLNILHRIADAAELTDQSAVLEIGPGLGSLTQVLLARAGHVVVVELDPAMANILQQELGHNVHLTIVTGDILTLDPARLMADNVPSAGNDLPADYVVVANLPYYITSAVIRHLLESERPPARLVLTVQREVAERIVAQPGDMSLLAVSVQFFGQARIVAHIPAGAFMPPPKVDSALVHIDTYRHNPYPVVDRRLFFRVAKAGFGQKRKQLRNALSGGLALPTARVVQALQKAGIDPQRRAQTLSLDEWAALSAQFQGLSPA